METRYGKVFVLHPDTTGDRKEITSKLLESTFFSNIDFKLYDPDGNLSPLNEKYKGKSFSVQFSFTQKDKNGQSVDLSLTINLPYKMGELAHQDFESVAKASEEMSEFWRNNGVFTDDILNENYYKQVRKGQTAAVIAAFCPGWKISQFKTLHVWTDPFFILDDHMDKATSQKDLTFKTSQIYYAALNRVLEGKPVESGESEDAEILSKMPEYYLKMIKGLKEARKVIVEKGGDPTYVIKGFKGLHTGLTIENCLEWKQKQSDPTSKLYAESWPALRVLTSAMPLTFDLLLFDRGLQISEEIRESFLFKSIIEAMAKLCGFVNDIWSLKKEMDAGETSNKVHILHFRDGLSLQDAYQKAVDRLNLLVQVVNENGELLTQLFGKEGADVTNWCKDLVNGAVQWHCIATRYHPDVKYNCILEIE